MFEDFECQCVFVEFTNDSVPRAGRVEYCASQCDLCRARGVMTERSAVGMAADSLAPRYQRTH